MKLKKYKSYEEYKDIQSSYSQMKKNCIWVHNSTLDYIVQQVKNITKTNLFGICHGVRNGYEVKYLQKKLPESKIIGTEISDVSSNLDYVIQWDFHEIKNEWINNVDFIYTNSFDHSYNPELCITNWMKCINKENGICFIEWTSDHNVGGGPEYPADCFGANLEEYITLALNYKTETINISNGIWLVKIIHKN